MGSVRIAVQNIIDLTDDLSPWPLKVMTFTKSRFGPHLSY